MKITSRAALVAIALIAGTAAHAQGSFKIAYVDTEALMLAAPGRAAAESTFQKEQNAVEAEMRKFQDQLKTLYDKYTADEPKLTPAQKEAREKEMNDLQVDAQAKSLELRQKLQRREGELMAPLQEAVKAVLDELREAGGYAIIFANEPGNSPIAAADKNLDITDKAVLMLRARSNTTVRRPPPLE